MLFTKSANFQFYEIQESSVHISQMSSMSVDANISKGRLIS